MERQYIFFNSARAFWFCALAFMLLMAISGYVAIVYKPSVWLFSLFVVPYCAGFVYVSFRLDRKPAGK